MEKAPKKDFWLITCAISHDRRRKAYPSTGLRRSRFYLGGKFRSERPRDSPTGSSERKWIFPASSANGSNRGIWISPGSSASGSSRGIWIFPASSASCGRNCSTDRSGRVVVQVEPDHRKAAGRLSDFHPQNCRTRKSQI